MTNLKASVIIFSVFALFLVVPFHTAKAQDTLNKSNSTISVVIDSTNSENAVQTTKSLCQKSAAAKCHSTNAASDNGEKSCQYKCIKAEKETCCATEKTKCNKEAKPCCSQSNEAVGNTSGRKCCFR